MSKLSGPVSRVLSWMMIYLRLPLPAVFSELPRKQTGPACGFQICSCFGWGLQCRLCYHSRGSLLHCHFNLTMDTLRRIRRYIFCCAFPRVTPGGRYPSSLPCEARTFLGRCRPRPSGPLMIIRLPPFSFPAFSGSCPAAPFR